MLLIYKKDTGQIVGTNDSDIATFENVYPKVSEEFKQTYSGIVVEYNSDYDRNRDWYKIENETVIKLDSPFIEERIIPPDQRDRRIADLEIALATLLGGAS